MNTFSEEIESQQGQDFFLDNNEVPKKKKNVKSIYSSTEVKARNLFYIEDISKKILIMQALSLTFYHTFNSKCLIQTPINLDRKLDHENERLNVKMLWDEHLPHTFTRFIYRDENYVFCAIQN